MITIPDSYNAAVDREAERVLRDLLQPRGLTRRRVLVVGSAGYIGSVLCGKLLRQGFQVRGLDCLLFNNAQTVLPYLGDAGFEFHRGDFTRAEVVETALTGVTDVILLAGLVGDPITKKYPDAAHAINDAGYRQLLARLQGRGLNKVVFVSTCSNYGLMEGGRLATEESELRPLSLYATAKVAIEQELLALRGKADFTPTVLRFATAFGLSPRMRFDLTVSEFTRAIARGEDLLVYDADTWRPYCHVRDFAEVITRVLEAPAQDVAFEVFNAGGDVNNYTKQGIVDAVLAQVPGGKVRYQAQGSDPRNYRVSFAKIRQRLHFEPSYSVPDGIRELIAALRQGFFADIAAPQGFYVNDHINYSVAA